MVVPGVPPFLPQPVRGVFFQAVPGGSTFLPAIGFPHFQWSPASSFLPLLFTKLYFMGIQKTEYVLADPFLKVSFHRILAKSGPRYFVTVIDKAGKQACFDMLYDGRRWRVVNAPRVDEKVLALEGQLAEMLGRMSNE